MISQAENARNNSKKSAVKSTMKKFEGAITANDYALASEIFPVLVSKLDAAKSDGIYHVNTVARKKARIAKLLDSIKA